MSNDLLVLKIRHLEKNEWFKILDLTVSSSQVGFIEDSKICLDDALSNAYDIVWNFYGVYKEEILIGFAMHGVDDAAFIENKRLWLDRFMIDKEYQGKGYGKQAMKLVIAQLLEDYKTDQIYLSVHDDNLLAIELYKRLGFTFTKQVDPMGELIMVYSKAKPLVSKKITKKLLEYHEVQLIINEAFPKEERMPLWVIRGLSCMKNYEFSAYYDDSLIGITFTIEKEETVFIFYLAINEKYQSQGYGTRLLQMIFEKYPNKSITLFIETLDDHTAPNYNQRIKRLSFYQRNGFVHTGIQVGLKKPFVDILSTDRNFDELKAKNLLKFIPLNIIKK